MLLAIRKLFLFSYTSLVRLTRKWPVLEKNVDTVKYVLKRVSFGSKDYTKELKLECAYFLGQTS